jgi:predicted DNA-binding protein (MmcQ/YjbR family)
MDKNHWNTVSFNSDVPHALILELIEISYQLVCNNLSKKVKKEAGISDY